MSAAVNDPQGVPGRVAAGQAPGATLQLCTVPPKQRTVSCNDGPLAVKHVAWHIRLEEDEASARVPARV